MSVVVTDFGKIKKQRVFLYTITNQNNLCVSITDFGANIVSLMVPDRNGKLDDIVLGFDNVKGYMKNPSFFGSTIGRNANRIGGAKFSINGSAYSLEVNDGPNNLHSSFAKSYNKRMYKAEIVAGNSVKFSLESPDGDQGFPGNLSMSVTFTLTDDNGLELEYAAVSDKDTVFNITNHSYFNLSGHASGSAMHHKLMLNASHFTPTVPGSIPTGEIAPVAGTPFDFTQLTTIGDRIGEDNLQLKLGKGYDHNFALDKEAREYAQIAVLEDPKSGRVMKTYTDLPGVQFYAGNCIAKQKGKGGAVYDRRHAVCLETQFFPDAINRPEFVSPVLKKGDKFYSKTRYEFSINK